MKATRQQIADRIRTLSVRRTHELMLGADYDPMGFDARAWLEAQIRAWAILEGIDLGELDPADLDAGATVIEDEISKALDQEDQFPEEPEDHEEEPTVQIFLGAGAWGSGPWGKVKSSIVAMYLQDWIDNKIARGWPAGDFELEVRPRKRVPAWVLATTEQARREWMDRIAEWIEQFQREGWKEYAELRDGSGVVPGTGVDP